MLYAALEHVADRHELVLAEADARRRSGRQKVSGIENHVGREIGHHFLDVEQHVVRVALLLELAVQ